MGARTGRNLVAGMVAVLVLAMGVGLPPARASGPPARFGTDGLWITDHQGRDLFLRGFDLMGAEYTPTDQALPYGPADLTAIRQTGATVVRLPIAWANIEPRPGYIDPAALARAAQIVHWAGAAGLDVVLDMHQWEWAPCFGGNGFPAWAVPNCPASPPGNEVQLAADIEVAATDFWTSAALQADFASAWAAVAKAVGAPPYLIGYDLLNEPWSGVFPPEVFENAYLAPFYREVTAKIRTVDPAGLVFVEPSDNNGAANGSSEFTGPLGIPGVVYEPHQYGVTSLNGDSQVGVADLSPAQFTPDLTVDQAVAQRMGAALWLGEWGALVAGEDNLPPGDASEAGYARDDLTAQNQLLMGSAYWSWDSSYKMPGVLAQLTRPNPYAIAGTPEAVLSGAAPATAVLIWVAAKGETLFSVPAGCRPHVKVSDPGMSWSSPGPEWVAVTAPAGKPVNATVTCGG